MPSVLRRQAASEVGNSMAESADLQQSKGYFPESTNRCCAYRRVRVEYGYRSLTPAVAGVELPQPARRPRRPEPDNDAFPGGATDDRPEPLLGPDAPGCRGRSWSCRCSRVGAWAGSARDVVVASRCHGRSWFYRCAWHRRALLGASVGVAGCAGSWGCGRWAVSGSKNAWGWWGAATLGWPGVRAETVAALGAERDRRGACRGGAARRLEAVPGWRQAGGAVRGAARRPSGHGGERSPRGPSPRTTLGRSPTPAAHTPVDEAELLAAAEKEPRRRVRPHGPGSRERAFRRRGPRRAAAPPARPA